MVSYVEVNQADVRRVMRKLKNLEKAPNHLRNAINRTATYTVRTLKAGAKQGYTIKSARFGQNIKTWRATQSNLSAVITASGRPPTVGNFKASVLKKAGGRADITNSGYKPLRTDSGGAAFMMKGLITQRRGSERFPLKVIYGNSVPKMVEKIFEGERGGQGDMEDRVRERLHEEMMKEVQKLM